MEQKLNNNAENERQYSRDEVIEIIRERDRRNALRKKEFWIENGCFLLRHDKKLVEKWKLFVEEKIQSVDITKGTLIDETLHIMTLILHESAFYNIRISLEQFEFGKDVISYLNEFIEPEIMEELLLNSSLNPNKEVTGKKH